MFVCNHDTETSTDNLQPAMSHDCKHVAEKTTANPSADHGRLNKGKDEVGNW